MALAFNFTGAVALLRALTVATLTTAGEPPAIIPLATSCEQAAAFLDEATLPLTVFEVGNGESEEQGRGYLLRLPITIHHLRALENGTGIAVETAMHRMQTLAAAIGNDYRLQSVDVDDTPIIENAHVGGLQAGNASEMQSALAQMGQTTSLCAVSLPIILSWWETL